MKKLYFLIITLLVIFTGYIILTNIAKDYNAEYNINGFIINEEYNNDLKNYTFFIEYQDKIFPLITTTKYTKSRNLINNIEKYEEEAIICLAVTINESLHPICYQEDELIDFRLIPKFTSEIFADLFQEYSNKVTDNYESLKIFNYLDNSYYIWNYKGYYYLNAEQQRTFKLIERDDYHNSFGHKINDYLITPNYDQRFYFDELLVFSNKNKELRSFKLGEEISYNSYYMGNYGDDLYLVDRKSQKQYKINIKRNRLQIIGSESKDGSWYNNGWESISISKLVNKEYIFIKDQIFNYELSDGTLYYLIGENKVKVSLNVVDHIVYTHEDEVYYIINNTLYMFSLFNGEVKLIENYEWSFNHLNKIFIFK